MTLFTQIKKQLQTTSKERLVKQMGYNSEKKGLEGLKNFESKNDLYSWLHCGFYDLKYTAQEFFEKLCKYLSIPDKDIKTELQKQNILHKEKEKFKDCYIFVDTNFKRTTEPIFALAFCESIRRFKLSSDKFLFKSNIEILELVSNAVKKHYSLSRGELDIWGKIANYIFHFNEHVYMFSVDGQLKKPIDIDETKAKLFLGKKNIFV